MEANSKNEAVGGETWSKEKQCSKCGTRLIVTAQKLQSDAQGNYVHCPTCCRVVRMAPHEVPSEVKQQVQVRRLLEQTKAQCPRKLHFH
ncbi:MAG: hypothetical protein V1928_03575 [Parcubacteria group bacterium]